MSQAMLLRYESRLIEEAVFLALRERLETREFQKQRERIYEVADPQERERFFGEMHRSWFARLGLGKVLDQTLYEQPRIASSVESCFVGCVAQAKEEGAELFVAPDGNPEKPAHRTLRLLLRPESLLNETVLKTFLRHEFFHIADMLDPAFAYEPVLAKADGGPTYDTLITNRYRVLWDVTINGRMLRSGWLDATVREQQREDFLHAFPMLDREGEELFERFFDAAEPRHSELAAFAFDPRAATEKMSNQAVAGTHCPLCRFPTHAFASEPTSLGAEVLAAIKADFSDWTPAKGLCVQCADLYSSRRLSMAALRLLPGWHP